MRYDGQVRVSQSETRIAVLGMGLVGGVHKKGCFAKQCHARKNGEVTRKNEEGG